MKNGTTNALLGFIAGASAGLITGILIAPDKGKKTRKKISKQASRLSRDLIDQFGEKVDELKDEVKDVVEEMREKAKDVENKVKEKVNSTGSKVKEETK